MVPNSNFRVLFPLKWLAAVAARAIFRPCWQKSVEHFSAAFGHDCSVTVVVRLFFSLGLPFCAMFVDNHRGVSMPMNLNEIKRKEPEALCDLMNSRSDGPEEKLRDLRNQYGPYDDCA